MGRVVGKIPSYTPKITDIAKPTFAPPNMLPSRTLDGLDLARRPDIRSWDTSGNNRVGYGPDNKTPAFTRRDAPGEGSIQNKIKNHRDADPDFTETSQREKRNYADGPETPKRTEDTIKNAGKEGENIKSGGMKLGTYMPCKKNAMMCMGAAGLFAYMAYTGKKTHDDMMESEKECLKACYPNDWVEAKKNKTRPDYKVEQDEEGNDTKYASLYETDDNMANALCTPDNMVSFGMLPDWDTDPDHCDIFCGAACDEEFSDYFGENLMNDLKNLVFDIPGLGPFLENFDIGKYLPYILGFIGLLILFKVLSLFKKNKNDN